MSKKTLKIINIITIILCVIMVASTCFAADLTVDDIEQKSNSALNSSEEGTLQNVGGTIMAIIRNVGIIVAVIILMVLGIKYMVGSAEEKAEYKKTMIPYLVGAVVLFGAAAIAQAVISLSSSITA